MKSLFRDKIDLILSMALLVFFAFFSYQIVHNAILGAAYPNEYREAVNIEFSEAVLDGVNPYAAATVEDSDILEDGGRTYPCYLYPPVYCYLCAGISYITHLPLVGVHYFVSIISMFATAVLAAVMVYRSRHSAAMALFAMILTLFCHWRFGYVSAAPDSFGLLLTMLMIYLTVNAAGKKGRIIALCILTVLIFFTKQYFITAVLTVLIYLWQKEKKSALLYFISCAVLTIAAFVLVTVTCPLFWTYTVYFLKGYETYFDITQFMYVFEQFFYMCTIFGLLLLMIVIWLVRSIISSRREDNKKPEMPDISRILLIQVIVQAICLLYFGLNDGSYLTYYLQMWIPYVVMLGIIAMDELLSSKKVLIRGGIFAFVMLGTIYLGYFRLPFAMLDAQDVSNWNEAYDMVMKYHENPDDIYYAPTMSYIGFELGDHPYDTGHINITRDSFYPYWLEDETAHTLYPYGGEVFEKHMDYRESMCEKAANHEYNLITIVEESDYTFDEEFLTENGYRLIESIPLQTGNTEYETQFYALD